MLENLYTTKMTMNKKKLQSRFSKIRSENGLFSKMMALMIFVAIILTMVHTTIILAVNFSSDEYAMSESEFTEFVNRPIGAVMADIYYADSGKIVFHYGEGLFIIHSQTSLPNPKLSSELDFVINLKKLNIAYGQQGSGVLDIKISKDGQYAYLSSTGAEEEIKGFDKYIITLDTGAVKKGFIPEKTELFTGVADTYAQVKNPIGWHSKNCIVSEEKIYYLTSETGMVHDIKLITVDKANKLLHRYIFRNTSVFTGDSEIAVHDFFNAFDKSELDTMKTLVTDEFIETGYIGDYGMCYGMTRATLKTCSKTNVDEFLKHYFSRHKNEQLTLSENDIELLKQKSDKLVVYTVVVMAESNIKGEIKPPFKRFLNVICKKQDDGRWLVHKLES